MLREERPRSTRWPGLIIEVTEDEIINDLTIANEVAAELRAHHCTLAIDDFGAGYSSLARLKQLPFSRTQDRPLLRHRTATRTGHNAGLCETIVELAHRFGLKTVAEGIETHHESHKLQGVGCDVGQGYLFAKPMPKEQFVSLLRRRVVRNPDQAERRRAAARCGASRRGSARGRDPRSPIRLGRSASTKYIGPSLIRAIAFVTRPTPQIASRIRDLRCAIRSP